MKTLVIALVACGSAAPARRDTLASIPKAAAAALERAAGGAKIESVERDGGNYEATWHVDGLEREAEVTASGELLELEEEVRSEQVPSTVRAMALVKLPNAQSIKFSRLKSGNYEVEAMIDGKEHEITMTPDGRDTAGFRDER
jgi:predicted aspartyl protease